MAIGRRDDATVAAGLAAWWAERHPGVDDARAPRLDRPAAGWSNETVLASLVGPDGDERLVVRLPSVLPTFPVYDLAAQAAVQRALLDGGIPAPAPVVVEADERWLGTPFFVMERAPGRPIGEVPALDEWLEDAGEAAQRRVHEGFLSLLAGVHRLDWRAAGLDRVLRGAGRSLGDEVRWWADYVDWSADGRPSARLRDLCTWCGDTAPRVDAPLSLCWGDARLGNALYDDHGVVSAALDWELASIGPAEMDLAWYLALDELTTKVVGRRVAGFLDRPAAIATYRAALGRPLHDLDWHEVFALVRSTAVNERQARTAAVAGIDYPGVAGDDNPMLGYIERRIERLDPPGS